MNLEQVARRAKVSTATVSRVLNNASVVKSSTRARVEKAIEELKYHPNLQISRVEIGMVLQFLNGLFNAGARGTLDHAGIVQNAGHRSRRYLRPPGHLFEVHARIAILSYTKSGHRC